MDMNIFYLSNNPTTCAKWHVDKHVVKMILETCQLLCSALWLTGEEAPYKLTHKNHPCAIWTRQNIENWRWLKSLGLALCKEYTFRYEKEHKCQKILENLKEPKLPNEKFTEPPQAMDNCYKHEDTITAYRNYYILGKHNLHSWKKREKPYWIVEALE